MTIFNPYLEFNFNDAEEILYKLIIQLSLIPRKDSNSVYHKIKATDLVDISKYSKPKVYDIIKRLEERALIQVDNTRPMFITPKDPEVAISNLSESRKVELEKASKVIINELKSLPRLELNYPFSDIPPLNFISGLEEYHKMLRAILQSAKKSIILIIGYMIRYEEDILRDFIKLYLKKGIEIKILYGGAPKFKMHFKKAILTPNNLSEDQTKGKIDIKAISFAPPIRMTIIDDRELIITLIKGSSTDAKVGIEQVSALHSDNEDLIEYARRTFALLRPTAEKKLAQGFTG